MDSKDSIHQKTLVCDKNITEQYNNIHNAA